MKSWFSNFTECAVLFVNGDVSCTSSDVIINNRSISKCQLEDYAQNKYKFIRQYLLSGVEMNNVNP
jgi:hypothetical protein